ncbi:hypothetical protein H6G17_28320 [Chroococcidiopsis sp. FACHB-1243]|uniref:hypothetical protein n=1 Tax=Chroococcidiopsis sp. [FACHB-1243] TaxID=2692781 RepID=UPI001781B9E9|nr:hypothetical protein [Chroococcidiopsis sp. [FACHB-1243]]MBD2309364.1 hypothetical protein [Chroococcidiopsis sp. [FACHB-1243]]
MTVIIDCLPKGRTTLLSFGVEAAQMLQLSAPLIPLALAKVPALELSPAVLSGSRTCMLEIEAIATNLG